MRKLENEYAAYFYCTSLRDSSGKPAGMWSTLKNGRKYTKWMSVWNWKTPFQSWKLCAAVKLSRAGATSKDSSFVRMTKLETEYFVYFYYTTVRDSNGKPPGKWSKLKTNINCTSLRSVRKWKTHPKSWKLCGAAENFQELEQQTKILPSSEW